MWRGGPRCLSTLSGHLHRLGDRIAVMAPAAAASKLDPTDRFGDRDR